MTTYVSDCWSCVLIYNVEKTTQGVTGRDVTDADKDPDNDGTDARNADVPETPSSPSRVHEKADMAVISATYPGELCNCAYVSLCRQVNLL